MRTTIRRVPVWELPQRLRDGRNETGFVDLIIEDAQAPSDAEKLAVLRHGFGKADEDVRAGRVHDAQDVFAELRAELDEESPR